MIWIYVKFNTFTSIIGSKWCFGAWNLSSIKILMSPDAVHADESSYFTFDISLGILQKVLYNAMWALCFSLKISILKWTLIYCVMLLIVICNIPHFRVNATNAVLWNIKIHITRRICIAPVSDGLLMRVLKLSAFIPITRCSFVNLPRLFEPRFKLTHYAQISLDQLHIILTRDQFQFKFIT